MGQGFDSIRDLVDAGKYVVGKHAAERLEERGILEWQAVVGLEAGVLLIERPDAISARPSKYVRVCLTARSSKRFGPCCGNRASQSW